MTVVTAAARAPRGEPYRSRGGHDDIYAGGLDHDAVLRVELGFLRRHSRTATTPGPGRI